MKCVDNNFDGDKIIDKNEPNYFKINQVSSLHFTLKIN